MDITSYLLGKGAAGGEAKLQNKSVTITENTTTTINPDNGYDGLKKVEVTTNVSGGAFIPKTAREVENVITSFKNYLDTLLSNYTPYTNNSLTIYTPNSSCKNFIIQKTTADKYRIIWSAYGTFCCFYSSSSSDTAQAFCNLRNTNTSATKRVYFDYSSLSALPDRTIINNVNDLGYYSPNYDTIEELVTALQTKNAITYNQWNTSFLYGGKVDETWTMPITNIPVFESDMSTPVVNGRVLSHNLTIAY